MSVASNYNRIQRGEKLLEMMAQRGTITETGKDFLLAALDPMHDNPLLHLEGWPDVEGAASVVRCYKKSMQLSAPTGLLTGANWDVVIMSQPIINECTTRANLNRINNIIDQSSDARTAVQGPIMIRSVKSGNTTSWFAGDDPLVAGNATQHISLPDDVCNGRGRLIGLGFEVNNTTASLHKQGNVTVFRQPQSIQRDTVWMYATDPVEPDKTLIPFTGHTITPMPENLESAMLLAGSRQWPAKDGCYCVVPFMGTDNPALPADYRQPILLLPSVGQEKVKYDNRHHLMTPEPYTEFSNYYPVFQANKWAPIHSTGAYFTGLSPETTLNLQVNFYYETFPTIDDTQIITLATPSAEYDPMALALYQHAISQLPVGVPADWNVFGEWFADIISKISKIAGPLSGPLSPVVLGAGAIADSYLAAQSPKSKPKPLQRPRKPKTQVVYLPARPSKKQKQQARAAVAKDVRDAGRRNRADNKSRRSRRRRSM